ncbi:MAG: hypothetical protein LLG01_15790 [Planctomycetaceae bacterium]|nr:hypothetical protein [Planctomycetaceae bacterium]
MNREILNNLRQRYARGEKVTALAKEAGIPWQRLWGILKSGTQQQQSHQETRQQRRPRRLKNRLHRSEGQVTSQNPVHRDSDGIDRITFDSVGEAVIDALADYAQNDGNRSFIAGRIAEHTSGHDAWANYFTREKLLDTIANPPRHLLDAVEDMRKQLVDEISPPVCTRRKVRRNQEWGDELEAESVLVRSLTPWERMTRETQPRRSVTIGVNLTVNAGQRSEHLLWRGAAAAALADILSQRGLNVEIVAFWTISRMSSESRMVVSRYVVKRADMPMDLGSVSVALAEIAYSRLVALYGLARHVPGVLDDGMGCCEKLPQQDRGGIDYLAEADITSRSGAESWLRQCASTQESGVLHV